MKPPTFLGRDGRKWWRDTVPALVEARVLDRIDSSALVVMATLWERMQQARREIDRDGVTVKGSRGQISPHPMIRVERQSIQEFAKLAERFGLDPIGRNRLGVEAGVRGRSFQEELESTIGPVRLRPVEEGT